jgi:hypothetical protein
MCKSDSFGIPIHDQGMGNPIEMELFHAERLMKTSQASRLSNGEVPAGNVA